MQAFRPSGLTAWFWFAPLAWSLATRSITSLALIVTLLAWRSEAVADPKGTRVTAADIVDGETMVIDRPVGEAHLVRLAGVEAPKPGRGEEPDWPLADIATQNLEDLVLASPLRLTYDDAPLDRYGRLLAQVHREDGLWVQEEMVRRGLGRVRTTAGTRSRARTLLASEQDARLARRGIWADPFYRVRTVDEVASDLNSFQIVEGRVRTATRVRDFIYLNFGPDWRTDFTVAIAVGALPAFKDAGLELLALEGKRIRVRGWIRPFNGPLIDATHPEQIELSPGAGNEE